MIKDISPIELRALSIITWRLFNKDHAVKVWTNLVNDVSVENSVPDIKNYTLEISSPAGRLVGIGTDVLSAYCDAIKGIQR